MDFGPTLLKVPVLLSFLRFMGLLEPRFSVGFSTIFGADFQSLPL